MTYESEKIKTISFIKKLVKKGGLNREDLAFFVLENTGFGKKFVFSYIDEAVERGFMALDANGVISIPLREEDDVEVVSVEEEKDPRTYAKKQ